MHHTARISKAKFSVPRQRERALDRPALQQRLAADALPPLTLIAAPAGFGKTTLAARAAGDAAAPWRSAWLGLTRQDANVLTFLHSVVAALRHTDARLAQASASLLDAPNALSADDLVLQLCDDLAEAPAPIVLVLDDYQLVDDAPVNAAVATLVEHLPAGLRLLLVSRRLPSLPLGNWRARGLLGEIGQQDLRFTLPETARFLTWTMALPLPDDAVQALDGHVEGWAAGLQMAALHLRRERADAASPAALALEFRGRHRFVMDYMTQEVLAAQPPAVRRFLHQTSMLQTLVPGLCDAVTERTDSQAVLAALDQSNMFISRLDDDSHTYRYHALFQEALAAGLNDAELPQLHSRARAWYEAHGLHREAFHHAWQADDIDGCARALHHLFEPMLCRGELRAFQLMLAALPQAAFERHPELALQQAWLLYLTSSAQRAAPYVELAQLKNAAHCEPALRGAMHTFRAYLTLNWGDPAATEQWARQAIADLPPASTYSSVVVLTYLGQAQSLTGQRFAALQTLRQAYHLGDRIGNHAKALDALMHLVMLLLEQGRTLQARQLAEAAVEQHRDHAGRPLPIAGLAHLALGAVHLACNELGGAHEALQRGVQLSRKVGVLYFVLMGQCLLARTLHARGERDAAWQLISLARETVESSGGPRRRLMVTRMEIELMLCEGRVDAAARLLPTDADAPARTADALLKARVLIGQQRHDHALCVLAPLQQAARHDSFDGSLVHVHVLQCLCQQALGKRQAALAALEHALALAAPAQLRRPFADEAVALRPALAELRHVAPEFVDSLQPASGAVMSEALLAAARTSDALSHREVALLLLINRGLRNQEIATQLSITIGTTKQYVNQLFGKLGARNRVEAILLGRQLKILQ